MASGTAKPGLGLVSMRERAELLGGSLSVESSHGSGCEVTLRIPWEGVQVGPVRVLLADDHTLFRTGVRTLLEQMQDMEVVGEAADGQEAVTQARVLVPDVILMDIQMPVINGIDATRHILQENPHIGVILVTMSDDPESVFSGMRAGARGYVLKEEKTEGLRRAIEAAYRGEAILGATIAQRVMEHFGRERKRRQPGPQYEEPSQRELGVLKLAAEGLSNEEIAAKLVLGEKAVKNHIANIFARLRVTEHQAKAQERERLDQEMRVARVIQQMLLPDAVPDMPGWQVAAYYRPASEVGGDFYDFIGLPDGRMSFVIGDATDKGVPAALVMATARAFLRAAVRPVSPGEVLRRVNDVLYPDIPRTMFVTCLYAVLDPRSGRLQYANAGHDLPYRRRHDGVEELRAKGMPLGLMPGMTYEEKEITLAPGESVLFYSDGLVEAHNPEGEMFGFPRLKELVAGHPGGAPLIDFLLARVAEFTPEPVGARRRSDSGDTGAKDGIVKHARPST